MAKRALFDSLRTIDFSGISGTYAAVGTPFDHPVRTLFITNLTAGHMIFSLDENDPAGHVAVPAGAVALFDVTSNVNPKFDDNLEIAKGEQPYIKQITAPVSGSVRIGLIYAK